MPRRGAAAAAGAAAGAASPSPIALRTIATTSSAVVAARRPAVKSSCMRLRASFESTARWASAAPSGAAMRKTRSAGPSGAPKSTPGVSRANASDGVTTAALFACGMAMPPGRPVSSFCSRAHASANSASASVARPCWATRAARERITAALSVPSGVSRDTNSGVIVWDTMTSNGRWCGGAGWDFYRWVGWKFSDDDLAIGQVGGGGRLGSGEGCRGCPVLDGSTQPRLGLVTRDVGEQVAGERTVARADRADDADARAAWPATRRRRSPGRRRPRRG